jgi:FK506-binding protein 2
MCVCGGILVVRTAIVTFLFSLKAMLAENDQQFDSSYDRGEPMKMVLGDRKRSIRGFDVGLQNACAGERRMITIPPAWGYGNKALG